jgi:hypothetical protein
MPTSPQRNRQGIQQPPHKGQMLALAPLLTTKVIGLGRTQGPAGQGQQGCQMVQDPRIGSKGWRSPQQALVSARPRAPCPKSRLSPHPLTALKPAGGGSHHGHGGNGARMVLNLCFRPVLTDISPDLPMTPTHQRWPEQALPLATELQRSLCINDRQWHALKGQRQRRAAEQISSALVLLLRQSEPSVPSLSSQGTGQEAIALLEHALGWLKGEIRDPGCPSHGR